MCGINGILSINRKNNLLSILEGLKVLEYRGYDSCGTSFLLNGEIITIRSIGFVDELIKRCKSYIDDVNPYIIEKCISHTRWSTNGEVSISNSHPFVSEDNNISIVHNGIIENYLEIKNKLLSKGVLFSSDTDSEVIVHLLKNYLSKTSRIEDALQSLFISLKGTFAILILLKVGDISYVCGLRRESPLLIGKDESESLYFSSDILSFAGKTKEILFLENNTFFICSDPSELRVYSIGTGQVEYQQMDIEYTTISSATQSTKGNFSTYMEKEIYDQKNCFEKLLTGGDESIIVLTNLIKKSNRIILIGCGSSYYSCLFGKYILEKEYNTPIEVDYASEFRYRSPLIGKGDLLISFSQSGESCDTLFGVKIAKEKGATTFSVCNVDHSSIIRESDHSFILGLGIEKSVAATKSFMGMCLFFWRVGFRLSGKDEKLLSLHIPSLIEKNLEGIQKVTTLISEKYFSSSNALYLGRGLGLPICLEGSLKLKEVANIHAEGLSSAELKHGHLALVDKNMPVVVIASNESSVLYEKILNNVHEVKARKGKIISIVSLTEEKIRNMSDDVISLNIECDELKNEKETLFSILSILPVQLLALKIAILRGMRVDNPVNLSKTVSVE